MKKIKQVLESNKFYFLLLSLTLIYVLIYILIPHYSIYTGEETYFEGVIESYKIEDDKLTLTINGEEKIRATYYFDTEEELNEIKNELQYGQTIYLTGTLTNPNNNTIPNTFNYKKYLYYHKIFYTCSIESFTLNSDNISILYKIKNMVINRIMSFEDISDYMLTFIIGDKSLLDDDTMDYYRQNGVTHLFAISGMHIGLFSGFLLWALKKIKIKESKRYLVTIIFIWFYAFLTAFSASVLRAALLFSLMALYKRLNIKTKSLNLLILTGSVLLISSPFMIMDLGFEYSFFTTFGLLYAKDVLAKHKIIGTSLIALFSALPITINNFYSFNILSFIANIVFVPLVSTVIYPMCLLTFCFGFLEPITEFFLNILEGLNTLFGSIDLFIVIAPKMNIVLIILYYIVFVYFVNRRIFMCSILLILVLIVNSMLPKFNPNYYIYFLDVGQGDSAVIISPYQKEVILIDTGGVVSYSSKEWVTKDAYKVSDNTITFLHSIGITTIDYMILTHGDSDHMKDALNVLSNMNVEHIILNKGEYNDLESSVAELYNIDEDYQGILDLNILWTSITDDENDNSIITLLNVYDKKILFMGDAPKEKELEILEKYNIGNVDIIKLGHHGSKTSSDQTFLESICVKEAIISSGRNNRYGHPSSETIETLEDLNITYYNTQINGTIEYKFSKNKIKTYFYEP